MSWISVDEHVMRELREELDIGVITSVPGAAKGIAAKMNIEKLLDIKINSCDSNSRFEQNHMQEMVKYFNIS